VRRSLRWDLRVLEGISSQRHTRLALPPPESNNNRREN